MVVLLLGDLKFRLGIEMAGELIGEGICCDRGAVQSVWNRDLRCIDWRGGSGGGPGLGGLGSGEIGLSGLLGI